MYLLPARDGTVEDGSHNGGLRVLLVDDHTIVRQGLRALLEKAEDCQVVGEADNGRTAVRLARQHRPDVVVMDLAMPLLNGAGATVQIIRENPGTAVVALSEHADRSHVMQMFDAGASGYLLKTCDRDELVKALRAAAAGKKYFSPELADSLLDASRKDISPMTRRLSQREQEVLQLVAEGKGSKEIAKSLNLSVKTVTTHRQNITKKLDIHTVAGLTREALKMGLVDLNG